MTGKTCEYRHTLSSEDLAILILDGLICANLLKKEDLDKAIEIATEEIDARKGLGDY
jgi:hypothetical protein